MSDCPLQDTTKDVRELLCKGRPHGAQCRADTRWCARYYLPSHPRPCTSYPDQGTLDWHLPTLPIWARGSLVPFRIWPGVSIPAHDLPQRRRRVLFLSGPLTSLCAGASLEAMGDDFVRGLGIGVPSRVARIWDLQSGLLRNSQLKRSRRNRTAATGRRALGPVGVPRKEKARLKAKIGHPGPIAGMSSAHLGPDWSFFSFAGVC